MSNVYCGKGDLSLGSLTMPRFMTAESVIQIAANEMNAQLGQVYKMPIVLDEQDPGQASDLLYLKVINAELATGSVILSAAGSGNDTQLQAYGNYLVRHARSMLNKILSGEVVLDNVESKKPTDNDPVKGPVMVSTDPVSMVDAFYDGTYANGLAPYPSPANFWRGGI